MNNLPASLDKKGRPLVFIAMIIGLWISARIIIIASSQSSLHLAPSIIPQIVPYEIGLKTKAPAPKFISSAPAEKLAYAQKDADDYVAVSFPQKLGAEKVPVFQQDVKRDSFRTSSGPSHQLLLFAHGMNRRNRFLGNQLVRPTVFQRHLFRKPNSLETPSRAKLDRWSLSTWAYVRPNNLPTALATGGQYGGSQAGAILRFHITDNPRNSVNLYSRVSSALSNSGEKEAALGVNWQPTKSIPASMSLEQRFYPNRASQTAMSIAAGFGPKQMIAGFNLEAFGQAGIVGTKNSTLFFDTSVTAEKTVAQIGKSTFSLGAGSWAGGQDKIVRLDIGPRASFRLPLPNTPIGKASAKLSLDWRHRVAGNAAPESGPALTLSTEF